MPRHNEGSRSRKNTKQVEELVIKPIEGFPEDLAQMLARQGERSLTNAQAAFLKLSPERGADFVKTLREKVTKQADETNQRKALFASVNAAADAIELEVNGAYGEIPSKVQSRGGLHHSHLPDAAWENANADRLKVHELREKMRRAETVEDKTQILEEMRAVADGYGKRVTSELVEGAKAKLNELGLASVEPKSASRRTGNRRRPRSVDAPKTDVDSVPVPDAAIDVQDVSTDGAGLNPTAQRVFAGRTDLGQSAEPLQSTATADSLTPAGTSVEPQAKIEKKERKESWKTIENWFEKQEMTPEMREQIAKMSEEHTFSSNEVRRDLLEKLRQMKSLYITEQIKALTTSQAVDPVTSTPNSDDELFAPRPEHRSEPSISKGAIAEGEDGKQIQNAPPAAWPATPIPGAPTAGEGLKSNPWQIGSTDRVALGSTPETTGFESVRTALLKKLLTIYAPHNPEATIDALPLDVYERYVDLVEQQEEYLRLGDYQKEFETKEKINEFITEVEANKEGAQIEKERKEIPLAEVEGIVREKLKGKAEIVTLEITETPAGLQIEAELQHDRAKKVTLKGVIVNKVNTIGIEGLDITAEKWESIARSKIEAGLSGFDAGIKKYFEEQSGKRVSSIQVGPSGLVVEFEPQSTEQAIADEADEAPADTGPEKRSKLKGIIERLVQRTLKEAKERTDTLKGYLSDRSKMLEGIGNQVEKYNKLSWKKKLALTGVLMGGVSLTATSLPIISAIIGTGLYGQRAIGAIGMAMNRKKALDAKIAANPDHWFAKRSEKEKKAYAVALAGVYMIGTSLAVQEGVEGLNALGMNEWIGNMREYFTSSSRPSPEPISAATVAPAVESASVSPPTVETTSTAAMSEATQQGPTEAASPRVEPDALDQASKQSLAEATEPVAAEAPKPAADAAAMEATPNESLVGDEVPGVSVEATKGKGYEYMLKRLWEKSVEAGLKPEDYPKGSDLRALLEADSASIDKTVHNLATDNEYFKETGRSVQVNLGDKMTLDTKGNIWMNDETILAHKEAPTTASYRPEVPKPEVSAPEGATPVVKDSLTIDTVPETRYGMASDEAVVPTRAPESEPASFISEPEGTDVSSMTVEPPRPENVESATPVVQKGMPPLRTEVVTPRIEPFFVGRLEIDPTVGAVYQDSSGAFLAYGNDYDLALESAKIAAKANPGKSIWIQAPDTTFYNNTWRPYVQEVKYGFFRGMQVTDPKDVLPSRIGAIEPKTFIKRVAL
jgi:hypothetical protein